MNFWLVKTEPSVFSFSDLQSAGVVGWDGVRNFQARNFMRAMQVGDQVVVYHSNASPSGVAGLAEVVSAHEPDPTQFDATSAYFDPRSSVDSPRWSWVHLRALVPLAFVSLDELRQLPELRRCPLVAKGSRLSVLPLTAREFDAIMQAAGPAC